MLCICTGNLARSPVAERLLAAGLDATVQVTSAGTYAAVGRPIDPLMSARLSRLEVAADGFRARQLTAAQLREADLVLALTREHRGAAVDLWPGSVRRAFTLLEFARLVDQVSANDLPSGSVADRLRAAVPLAAGRRRMLAGPAGADDVPDPHGQPDDVYEVAFTMIVRAATMITRAIGPPGGADGNRADGVTSKGPQPRTPG